MGSRLIGRDDVVVRAVRTLGGTTSRGVLLGGGGGVGRSRVLAELADVLERRPDTAVMRVRASAAGSTVALGALATLLPSPSATDASSRAREAIRVVRGAGPAVPVLVVDDAHLLDEASVAVVHALVTNGDARALVTVRDDLPMPTTLSALVKDGHLERIEVGPLDPAGFEALLSDTFTGEVPVAMREELWRVTAGHPLYLRLVTEAARASGSLVREGTAWRWEGWPADAPLLVDVVAERTSGLSPAAVLASEVLALAGPLPGPVAQRSLGLDAWVELEQRGLAVEDSAGEVRIGHPFLASVLAARVGPARRRAHAGRLAEAWRGTEDRSRLEAARWRLEAGDDLDPVEGLETARLALAVFDLTLSERLARHVLGRAEPSAAAHLLLAEALRGQARGDEAMEELSHATPLADDDDTRARIAVARAETASLLLGDLTVALDGLREAAETISDPEACRRVARQRIFLGAFAGDFRQVVAASLSTEGGWDPESELDLILATTFAQVLSVHLDGLDDRLERGRVLAGGREGEAPFAGQQLAVCRTLGMLGQGQVESAFDVATRDLATARASGAPTGFPAICVAFAGCFTGDIEVAADAGIEAVRSVREVDPFGVEGLASSIAAAAALQCGRGREADQLLAEPGGRLGADLRAQAVMAQRMEAWREVRDGRLRAAATVAAAGGQAAVVASHCLWGAAALHDAVRFGHAELVVDDLRALSEECPSPLIEVFLAHAEAQAAADPKALEAVAARFAAVGCRSFAVEAEAQAAALVAGSGDEVGGARLATRARIRWATCTGVEPPSLARAPSGLTPRQQQVAHRASRGATSREIADALFVSTRTVDNHLRGAYRMLGVRSREGMAEVLDDGGEGRAVER